MHDVTFLSLEFQNFKTLSRTQKSKENASVRTDTVNHGYPTYPKISLGHPKIGFIHVINPV